MLARVMLDAEYHRINHFRKTLNRHRDNPRWIADVKLLKQNTVYNEFSRPWNACHERHVFL